MGTEVVDVAPGLWLWRREHPEWSPEEGWGPVVNSTCVETGGEVALLDALAPTEDSTEVWERLDARPPTLVAVLKPDHVRDVDLFAARYGARAFGPTVFHRGDVPKTELESVDPGDELPGGIVALYDGRNRNETPLWIPEVATIVFADALMTDSEGVLRVCAVPWHEERVLPALRALLGLPFERVVIAHGEPVHERVEVEAALEREPLEA
jgi:hypothetical protein